MAATWTIERADDSATGRVIVSGQFDLAAEESFVAEVGALLADGVSTARLDFAGVDFIDSSGVRAILRLRVAHPDGVHLTEVSPAVDRVLQIAGISDLVGEGGAGR
jgi:anti-sigma B factor antagonist